MNRVEYTERYEAKKVNDPFDFPKDLYIDRFMVERAESALKEEQKMVELQKQKILILDQLDRFKNYFGDRDSISGNIFEKLLNLLN